MKLMIAAIAFSVLSVWAGYNIPVSVPCAGPNDPVNKECWK